MDLMALMWSIDYPGGLLVTVSNWAGLDSGGLLHGEFFGFAALMWGVCFNEVCWWHLRRKCSLDARICDFSNKGNSVHQGPATSHMAASKVL